MWFSKKNISLSYNCHSRNIQTKTISFTHHDVLGGIGQKAYVEIVKKKEGFDRIQMKKYESQKSEYERLTGQVVADTTHTSNSKNAHEFIDLT